MLNNISNTAAQVVKRINFLTASMYFRFLVTTYAAISTKTAMIINAIRIRKIYNRSRPCLTKVWH